MAEKTGAVNGHGVDNCRSNGCGGTNYIPGRGGKNGKGNGIARGQVWAPAVSPPEECMEEHIPDDASRLVNWEVCGDAITWASFRDFG